MPPAGSKYALTLHGPVGQFLLSESLGRWLEKDSHVLEEGPETQTSYSDDSQNKATLHLFGAFG